MFPTYIRPVDPGRCPGSTPPKGPPEMSVEGLLQGKVAVVTGAASGLGRSTAELFAEQGAAVVIADLHDERGAEVVKEIEALGGRASYLRADVSSSDDMRDVVQLAEDVYGRLDIMVANAGIAGPIKALEDVEDDEMRHVFEVNFFGIWRAFKYAVPALRRVGGGSMSATGSLGGVQVLGGIKRGCYGTTKAAMNAMTAYFAGEVAADKIRVNCVAAGGMSTNIIESYTLSAEELAKIQPALPQGRARKGLGESPFPVCDPREVAKVHLFLNSDLGSFVNGQTIVADAGGYITTVAEFFPTVLKMQAE
jgi:NAD(P)-dependent dehydrogenase (short-subunit alcohol dehydrogenase family)